MLKSKDHVEKQNEDLILKINDIYKLEVAKVIHSYNLKKTSTCPLGQLINSTDIKQDPSKIKIII